MTRNMNEAICLIIAGSVFSIIAQLADASPRPHYGQYKRIQDIAGDTSTPQNKPEVVAQLSRIVLSETENIHARQFAAEKLGELKAVEVRDSLKDLADRLKWADSTRQLKRAVTLAYWQIRVCEEQTKEAQEDLLIKLLWSKNHTSPHADVVPSWAADELANRGVKRGLSEIAKPIRYWNPTERGEEHINLCTAKIELLSTSSNRQDALIQALTRDDSISGHVIKRWAISELRKTGTQECRAILIGYALDLQKKHYDASGTRKTRPEDQSYIHAAQLYDKILESLTESGLSAREIKATGLQLDKFFWVTP